MTKKVRRLLTAAGITAAVFTLVSSFKADVTISKTEKIDQVSYSQLTAGFQTILEVAQEKSQETEVHVEITEVLNEGIVQNNIPGYDWNEMVLSNVEDSVNMRSTPDESGEIVGKLPKGASGTILEGTQGWTKISSGSVEGWVSDEFLLFGTDAEEMAEQLGSYQAEIQTEGLRIRKEPAEDAGVYDLAEMGSTYKVVEQMDGWVAIQLKEDVGYVSSEYVTIAFKLDAAKSIEEIRAAEEKAKKEAEAKKRKEAEQKAANASDVAMLAALVQLEAGGESFEGKLGVASVVMNRVRSGGYPNTVKGVIYQSGQFPPAHGARMAALVAGGASVDCVKAAKQALGGVSNIGGLTHFHAARLGGSIIIGNHAFY